MYKKFVGSFQLLAQAIPRTQISHNYIENCDIIKHKILY